MSDFCFGHPNKKTSRNFGAFLFFGRAPFQFVGLKVLSECWRKESCALAWWDKGPMLPRWWQLKYFVCSPRTLGKISNLTNIFSTGLKPPTSCMYRSISFMISSSQCGIWNSKASADHTSMGGGFFFLLNFHPYLGKWSNFTIIFQMGWNYQLDPTSLSA